MEHAYPHLAPVDASLVVSNVLPGGAAFGVRMDTGESCYIPMSIAMATRVAIGAEVIAKLVPNRFIDKADRTPWLVVYLTHSAAPTLPAVPVQYTMPFEEFDIGRAPASVPEPEPVAAQVRRLMKGGGVWTTASLFAELVPDKRRADSITTYNAVSAAVRGMFDKGECAKFQLWRGPKQSKPSREWFTCYPGRADVDEWEEK